MSRYLVEARPTLEAQQLSAKGAAAMMESLRDAGLDRVAECRTRWGARRVCAKYNALPFTGLTEFVVVDASHS